MVNNRWGVARSPTVSRASLPVVLKSSLVRGDDLSGNLLFALAAPLGPRVLVGVLVAPLYFISKTFLSSLRMFVSNLVQKVVLINWWVD